MKSYAYTLTNELLLKHTDQQGSIWDNEFRWQSHKTGIFMTGYIFLHICLQEIQNIDTKIQYWSCLLQERPPNNLVKQNTLKHECTKVHNRARGNRLVKVKAVACKVLLIVQEPYCSPKHQAINNNIQVRFAVQESLVNFI